MDKNKELKNKFGIPDTETIKVKHYDHLNTLRYITTQHIMLLEFYLYQIDENGKSKKVATNSSIPEFKKLEKDQKRWLEELEKIKGDECINE